MILDLNWLSQAYRLSLTKTLVEIVGGGWKSAVMDEKMTVMGNSFKVHV